MRGHQRIRRRGARVRWWILLQSRRSLPLDKRGCPATCPEQEADIPEFLLRVKQAAIPAGITVEVRLEDGIHDRSIVTDTGWRINLGRGLDIFQYSSSDAFDLAARLQEYRQVKAFGITYIRERAT